LLENKNIEKMDLRGKLFKNNKDNGITTNGLICLKESLIKNKFLKDISFEGKRLKKIKIRKSFNLSSR
jgi:hypothetical protein